MVNLVGDIRYLCERS